MQSVLRYIHDNIKKPLNADDVARKFYYSKWYFCKKFKLYTGRTFVEYVRHYRLNLAATSLLLGEKVIDIAMDYGYETVSGFNKAFFKEYGCAPLEYRKQVAESQFYYEKRRLTVFQISDRVANLREEALFKREYEKLYNTQRNFYFLLGTSEAKLSGLSNSEIMACGVVRALNGFEPVIIPGEVIVGFNYGSNEKSNIDDTEEYREVIEKCKFSEKDLLNFFEFKKNPVENPNGVMVEENTPYENSCACDNAWSATCCENNHTQISYETVLKKGFAGVLEDVKAGRTKNGDLPIYRSCEMICLGAMELGKKYAKKAKELLASENPEYNPKDLKKIIEICSNVPENSANSFAEAVQSVWFTHIVNTWEDEINANSLGRLDQILYPYYKNDVEKGIITKEKAFEILCMLWIKLYRDYDVQQSCVGGTKPDGTSAVNELSYMMLDVTEQLEFVRCLSVRYSKNTEREFLRRALEVNGHLQKGVPFFFNDDIMIPALEARGISHEDACDYTQLGCVETVIPGKSNPHATSAIVNLLKTLEYVLGNGKSLANPDFHNGCATGELERFKTFEKLYAAIIVQIEFMLENVCKKVIRARDVVIHNSPRPVKSLLTENCLESGKDFAEMGAKYDYYQIPLCGIPNLADSLVAIKRFVYDEHKYTLEDVIGFMKNDFPDEAVRSEFINKAPKYGNDIDEVDEIATDILEKACDVLEKMSVKYGLEYHAQPFSFLWMLGLGGCSIATPDGRHAGEPLAYSCSPMQGRDFNGVTAVLNSIAKLPGKKAPGTVSAIVEVDPKLFCDRNIDAMTDIFIAASNKGLMNVQFNIVDADTLIDAQKHPERYSNLAVRVSGFSQKFNLLTPEIQNHIIGRTKHKCL